MPNKLAISNIHHSLSLGIPFADIIPLKTLPTVFDRLQNSSKSLSKHEFNPRKVHLEVDLISDFFLQGVHFRKFLLQFCSRGFEFPDICGQLQQHRGIDVQQDDADVLSIGRQYKDAVLSIFYLFLA